MLRNDVTVEDGALGVLTIDGGFATLFTNDTGGISVKGTLVRASHDVDGGVSLCQVGAADPMGVVYESGIADGDPVYVVISGIAEILLQDGLAATRGYWVLTSATQAGRVDPTQPDPPNESTLAAHSDHFKEVGHCLESKSSGIDVLAKVVIHFN